MAQSWRYAEGVYIPKEGRSENINLFRIISLLSVESKIFFSIVVKMLSNFLQSSNYIQTLGQKVGIPGILGASNTQAWLDLANAYGSIAHKLVEVAQERHHIPQKVKYLILDYLSRFSFRVSSGQPTSDWHQLEVRIITGCTISVTLFTLEMNMLVKSAETEYTVTLCGCPWVVDLLHGQPHSENNSCAKSQVVKSGLLGRFKAWVYQHGILPRIL